MIKKDACESYIRIFVDCITVDVRIGLHPWEQKPQPLVVDVALYADPVSYLNGVDEKSIINYQRIHEVVKEWPGRAHIRLMETYVRELLDTAFGFKKVEAARVSVKKPNVFPDADGAGVEVFMTRKDYKKLK